MGFTSKRILGAKKKEVRWKEGVIVEKFPCAHMHLQGLAGVGVREDIAGRLAPLLAVVGWAGLW